MIAIGWFAFLGLLYFASTSPQLSPPEAYHADKILHVVVYGAMAFIPALFLKRINPVIIIILLLSIFGAGIELAQNSVEGRTGSNEDAIANFIGALLGGVVGYIIGRKFRKPDA